jgi:hypothetical protein
VKAKPEIDEQLFALAARVAALTLGRTSYQDTEREPMRYGDLLRGTVVTAYMELLDAREQILEELARLD